MSDLLPALLPVAVFIVAIVSRRGPVVSSVAGMAVVLAVVWVYGGDYRIDPDGLWRRELPVVLILTLSTALVIFPGQVMNSLLTQAGVINRIRVYIEGIGVSRLKLAAIIVLGVAPGLESMTGFGVSLFLTVPVLMHLFSVRKALMLSLLSMNIMPWGTLGLATLMGAQITGLSFTELVFHSSLTSFLVFPVMGCMVYLVCREDGAGLREGHREGLSQLLYPVVLGLLLASLLVFYSRFLPGTAGACAGISVAVIAFLAECVRARRLVFPRDLYSGRELLALFTPYLILLALIVLSRTEAVSALLQSALVIRNGDISFPVLTSPGVFIALTVILLYAASKGYRGSRAFLADGAGKAVYPVVGILMFVAFARLQQSGGLLQALAVKGSELSLTENVFIAPAIGMISGYITGSNVGGNVLFMTLQTEVGTYFDRTLLFAAVQNSSAGHAVFMSVPIILLVMSIAQADDARSSSERDWLIRRVCLCAPFIYLALTAAFYMLAVQWHGWTL